ncbi:hypothetical protein B5M09_004305 [Aphanomyces astaci]|uniref:AGC protein kinase n=1 Tax=Aphanomyces astaci TaxID=112090 RepID=A0A425D904_APHAT|nr:hypothetical protein B5M09_004305 [Aphanomyces astaci]
MSLGFDYSDEEILCRGYLTKRGHVVTNWKMRYFVLRPHASLSYYEDESMAKKLGQVHLAKVAPWEYNGSLAKSVSKRESRGSSSGAEESRYGFMFFTTKRVVYYIYTTSAIEHQKWFHAVADYYVHTSNVADCEGYMTKKTPGTLFSFSRPKYVRIFIPKMSEDAYRSHEAPISAWNIRAASRWEDGLSFQGEAGAMLFLSAPSEADQQRWMAATQEKVGSSLQPIACAGYLTKQGHKRKSWKKRYFVLRGSLLSYYTDYDSTNKQCLAEVGIEDVQVWDGEMHGFMFTTSEQVVYYVYAESERERQKWLVSLKALLDAQSTRAPKPLAMGPPPVSKVCPKCRHMVTGSKFCGNCGHHVDVPYDDPRPPRTPPRQPPQSQPQHIKRRDDDDEERQDRNSQTLLISVMQATHPGRSLVEPQNRQIEQQQQVAAKPDDMMPEDTTVDASVDDELAAALEKANLPNEAPTGVPSPRSNQATHNVIVVRPSRMADDEDYSESEDEQHPNQGRRRLTNDSIDEDEPPMLGDDKGGDVRESSLCELVMDGIVVGDEGNDKRSKMETYLEHTLGFDAQWVPSREAKASCRFYTSKNYNVAADVLVFLGDSGKVGIWKDETDTIDDPTSPMSMLPYVEAALKLNFGVVLCNPHHNTVDVRDGPKIRTFTVQQSASPAEHLHFVWTNYIAANVLPTTRVGIVAAGRAGKAVITLMQDEEATVYEKLNRVAFLQSTHAVDSSLSMVVLECLGRRAINWEGADGQALCSQVVNSQSRVGCVCMATGFKSANPPDVASMYPFDLTADHLKHMQVPIFAYLTANPAAPGMTAIVKHMRSTLKKGRSSSGRTRAPPEAATPEPPQSKPPTKPQRTVSDPSITQFYLPGQRGHTGAAEMGKKRQQAGTGRSNISIKDFELLKVVGQGGFGKVFMGRKVSGPDSGQVYAIKVLQKDQVVSNGLVHTTMAERHILIEVAHPFVVKLHYAFQSDSKLYLVMDYLSAGSLAVHLRKWRKFPETFARFYAAEVALAIAHLHQVNIIYRDVKLENVLMDSDGHVSIADFGLSKQGVSGLKGAKTFCGTAAYIAPELLKGQNYGKAADWWSFGILLYEMIGGKPPYYHRNRDIMFQTILTQQWVTFTPGFSDAAVDLIRGLLNRDPMQRLGSGPTGADEVLMHPFFKEFDWQLMLKRQVKTPYDPQVGKLDTAYVPRNVRQDGVTARDREASMLFSHDGDFRGFSFIGGDPPSDLS